jgi:biotin carboxylase
LRSAANDGVRFCDSPLESVAAYEAIQDTASVYLYPNAGVVAQEYLYGTEYIVNTVSRDGCHRVTDMWRYSKISANGILDRINGAFSVPEDCAHRESLAEYAFAVLEALAVRHGPAHLEIMLTPTGPCLVEAGIRLCGADTAYYADLAGGESQISWTVTAYTDPERFAAHHADPFRLRRNVVMAFFTSPAQGTLRSYPRMNAVKALESFHDVRLNVRPGEELRVTVDDVSEPLVVSLAHPSESVVARDFATLCYLDGPGFYELETA